MNRPRAKDKHLPRCVYHRHGAYWYVRAGKWTRLGTTLKDALVAYAAHYDLPKGGMAALIDAALVEINRRVKPTTASQYRTAARKLKKILAEFRPEDVQPKHIAAIKVSLAATPGMANRCLSVLRQVFHHALEQQLVTSNPAIGIRRHVERKRTRLITPEEYAAIYRCAVPRLQVIMDLLRITGQRVRDVLGIRRADITLEGIRFRQAKTDARLIVRMTPELSAVVERAKSLHGNLRALTLLHNRRGKAPDYRTTRDQWDRACAAAGITDAHMHDLRAVAATWARKQGLDATALLGHASPQQTARYLRERDEPLVEGPSFGQPVKSFGQ